MFLTRGIPKNLRCSRSTHCKPNLLYSVVVNHTHLLENQKALYELMNFKHFDALTIIAIVIGTGKTVKVFLLVNVTLAVEML